MSCSVELSAHIAIANVMLCYQWSAVRIRYHSLFDNKFLRYYTGHTNRVTSLVMHPSADAFVSASLDGTICIWDLRRSEPTVTTA